MLPTHPHAPHAQSQNPHERLLFISAQNQVLGDLSQSKHTSELKYSYLLYTTSCETISLVTSDWLS